jgi:uncharacterized protein YndB with AHSA1/START domain
LVARRVDATPERAFAAFTAEIGRWWRPNRLFEFSAGQSGTLAFEPGPEGRLVETYDDGSSFVITELREGDPPHHQAVGWRQASFAPDQSTELRVRFVPVGVQTRVTVEHFGWDGIPPQHPARHGFPLAVFQLRFAEWWQGCSATWPTWLPPFLRDPHTYVVERRWDESRGCAGQ